MGWREWLQVWISSGFNVDSDELNLDFIWRAGVDGVEKDHNLLPLKMTADRNREGSRF